MTEQPAAMGAPSVCGDRAKCLRKPVDVVREAVPDGNDEDRDDDDAADEAQDHEDADPEGAAREPDHGLAA